jgi:hypothetical protein
VKSFSFFFSSWFVAIRDWAGSFTVYYNGEGLLRRLILTVCQPSLKDCDCRRVGEVSNKTGAGIGAEVVWGRLGSE